MKPGNNAQNQPTHNDHQPYAVLGAGKLVSFLWKDGNPQEGWQYTFNVFRADRRTGEVSQTFRPTDVKPLAKLTRLLAFELANDACLPPDLRDDLGCLASCLDDVLQGSGDVSDPPNAHSGGAVGA